MLLFFLLPERIQHQRAEAKDTITQDAKLS
jgi:hypothetical protein